MNNNTFLHTKKTNLINYLSDVLNTNTNISLDQKNKGAEHLATLSKMSNHEFIPLVILKIMPHANNLDVPLNMILEGLQLTRDMFTSNQLDRVKLYLQCFCDIINAPE